MSSSQAPPDVTSEGDSQSGVETRVEAFIDQRLRHTRRQVKGVDIADALLTLGIGGLVYLLAAAVIDHWVVVGGLGFWGRLLLFLGMLATGGAFAVRYLLPPLLHRINPLFAAHTIEQNRPALKNSLINFLMLRGHRQEVAPSVYREVEHQAASHLAAVPVETEVDRTHVIRRGYVLAGVFGVFCLYLVLSPKNPLTSAARVIWPWADRAAPTRVTIENLTPGDVVEFRGEQLEVSARFEGLDDDESVLLYYTTADGQSVDQAITMQRPEDSQRYQCKLPPGELGLQQDLQYYLRAGDCITRRFAVKVRVAPAILVEKIEYDYPDYTGIPNRVVLGQGDIRAIEGTKVTIHATANGLIASARIDLNCDGGRELKMKVDDQSATGRFTLRLAEDDPTRGEYDSYQLRLTDPSGNSNRRPVRHWIDVVPDLPPEVEIVEPKQEEVRLAQDEELAIRVRAEDPDFALGRVALKAEKAGRRLPIRPLLDGEQEDPFEVTYMLRPERLGLKPGDRVVYWVEAEDNKQPRPGRAETSGQWITIIGPDTPPDAEQSSGEASQQPQQGDQQRLPGERPDQLRPEESPTEPSEPGKAAEQPTEPQPQEESPAEEPQEGQAKPSPDGAGDQSDQQQPSEPIDSDTQDGDAFEEILKDMEKEKADTQQEDQQQPPEQQQADQQQAGQEPSEQQQPTEQQKGSQQGDAQAGGKQPSDQPKGDQPKGDQQTGDQQPGEPQQDGGTQDGQQPPGEKQTGSGQDGQPGQEQPGQGERQPGAGKQGEPKQGESESAAGQTDGSRQEPGKQDTDRQPGGEHQPDSQQSPGAGEKSDDQGGSPSPQQRNAPKEKQPGQPGKEPGEKSDPAESPSISPKQSDSQSDTPGDRSGGGKKGGGQDANQPGKGTAGTQAEDQQGSPQPGQQGDAETGQGPGDQAPAEGKTGRSGKEKGTGSRKQPGQESDQQTPDGQPGKEPSQQDDSDRRGTPQKDPADGGRPQGEASEGQAARGQGKSGGGGRPSLPPDDSLPPETTEPGGDDPNLDFVRKRTDLALEHLRDQMQQDQSELLDRLGWTPDEAQRFIDKWQRMKDLAARKSSGGKAARKKLEEAIRSLGLRPRGTELGGGKTDTDDLRQMREGSHHPVPSKLSDLLRAYSKGIAGKR